MLGWALYSALVFVEQAAQDGPELDPPDGKGRRRAGPAPAGQPAPRREPAHPAPDENGRCGLHRSDDRCCCAWVNEVLRGERPEGSPPSWLSCSLPRSVAAPTKKADDYWTVLAVPFGRPASRCQSCHATHPLRKARKSSVSLFRRSAHHRSRAGRLPSRGPPPVALAGSARHLPVPCLTKRPELRA